MGAAQATALAMAGILMRMERAAPRFRLCRWRRRDPRVPRSGRVAAVMHMEGAEAIGPDLDALHVFHAAGLRSLGPVWSRPTAFGHGVPFRYPGDPDTGPGLTAAGKDLVRACDALGILVDLLAPECAGFRGRGGGLDRAAGGDPFQRPRGLPLERNLTDRQLAMIAERGGMVGLNFATGFLRPDGARSPEMGWEPILRHLDHLIARLGEDHVGFGSDFDGATLPLGIGDVTGLPALQAALGAHGYDEDLLRKLAHGTGSGCWRRPGE